MSCFMLNYVIFILLHVDNIFSTDIYEEKFKNYSFYQVTAFSRRERAVLYSLYTKVDDMVFVNGITNEASLPMDVLVGNHGTDEFESLLQSNDIEYVQQKSIGKISDSGIKGCLHGHLNEKVRNILQKEFLCYNVIRQWIKNKTEKSNMIKEIKIGQTFEKRDIFVLKLSSGKNKKAVFLMGGEEGRDWTSPAMLLNLIEYILDKAHNIEILMKHYDFYILPIFNPDGYTYSMVKDRVWTKNSRIYFPKVPCNGNRSAVGISIDRNWYFHNEHHNGNDECDPIFAGLKPLSEEETIAVSKFLNQIALSLMAFINIRGFENLITIPYSYDIKYCNNYDVLSPMLLQRSIKLNVQKNKVCVEFLRPKQMAYLAKNYKDKIVLDCDLKRMDIAAAAEDAVMKSHNSTFYYGLTSKYIYNFSGNVADWVKKELNIPIVYTFYMKVEPYILPNAADVGPLTDRLATMTKQVLLLANIFYGPLFNGQLRNLNTLIVLFLNIFNTIIRSVCKRDFP